MRAGRSLSAAALSVCVVAAGAAEPGRLAVMLDPGHTPKVGGAIGARGLKEVAYNDRLAALLADTLSAHGMTALLSRRPGEEISLAGRVAAAERDRADCFISLHHDSAQPKYLERSDSGGVEAYSTRVPIRGFSVFVSAKNGKYRESLALARSIGSALLKLGRKPALHHAEPIPGENRPLLDSALGLYRFDDLKVLAGNPLPAVLIEFGVLPDRTDEAYVSDPGNQARFAQAVYGALREHFRSADGGGKAR